jgi:hypothetical protein
MPTTGSQNGGLEGNNDLHDGDVRVMAPSVFVPVAREEEFAVNILQ